MVGVVLNGVETEHKNPDYGKQIYKDQKLQKIFNFLGNADFDVDALTHYNLNSILELKILSVDVRFRGRRIASKLYEITENFARNKGFQVSFKISL